MPANVGWREERKNKGKGERDEEFHVNSVCRDSCHRPARSLETLTDSSVKRAAPAPVFVCDCERETDCTYSMQTHVTVKMCMGTFACEINYTLRKH